MRTLPTALAWSTECGHESFVRDTLLAALTTHGHPRALVGALAYASAVCHLLAGGDPDIDELLHVVEGALKMSTQALEHDARLSLWVAEWNRHPLPGGTFTTHYAQTVQEIMRFLRMIPSFLNQDSSKYYGKTGALSPDFKGSGTASTACALYVFARWHEDPTQAITVAVNQLGSDTDTIASFVGGLVGSYSGRAQIPNKWIEKLQDSQYIQHVADRLLAVASGRMSERRTEAAVYRSMVLRWVYGWDSELADMLSLKNQPDATILNPVLGKGRILSAELRRSAAAGGLVKIIRVKFAAGQTCVFHSRIRSNGEVTNSLWKEASRRSLTVSV